MGDIPSHKKHHQSELDEFLEDVVPVHVQELAQDIVDIVIDDYYTHGEKSVATEKVEQLLNKNMGTHLPSSLSFADYQRLSRRTAIYPNMGRNILYPTLGLNGESSETVIGLLEAILGLVKNSGNISEAVKKSQRDDAGILTHEKREQITKELGDILWYISALSWEIGVPLHVIAKNNISKLHSRKKRGKLKGSGDDR